MNNLKLCPLIILVFIFSVSACAGTPVHVSLTVIDDDGEPVADADVSMSFLLSQGANVFDGNTDSEGKVQTTDLASYGVGMVIEKDGYYRTRLRTGYGHQKLTLLLREKKNPIAMYAKRVLLSNIDPNWNGLQLGYDLQVGDFVSPYGKGVVSDLLIKQTYDRGETWHYNNVTRIRFSNPGDGLIPFHVAENRKSSKFGSDYLAPETGYQEEFVHRRERRGLESPVTGNVDRDRNFYFRVRTVLNEEGEVKSAHYGKIYGEIPGITHYFNPTPNDRNVEYEVLNNLFEEKRKRINMP